MAVVSYGPDLLPITQPTVSKWWREPWSSLIPVSGLASSFLNPLSFLNPSPDSWCRGHHSLYAWSAMPVLVLSMMRFTWAVMLVLVVVFLWRRGRLIDSEAKHLVCQLVSWSLTSLFSTNMAISGTNLVCHKLAMGTTDQSSFQLLWSGSALFKFWDTLHIFGMVKATEILNKLIIKRRWLIDWAVIWCFTPHKNKSFWPITRCTFWLGLYLSL